VIVDWRVGSKAVVPIGALASTLLGPGRPREFGAWILGELLMSPSMSPMSFPHSEPKSKSGEIHSIGSTNPNQILAAEDTQYGVHWWAIVWHSIQRLISSETCRSASKFPIRRWTPTLESHTKPMLTQCRTPAPYLQNPDPSTYTSREHL
jgi:hypothetical protein